MPIDPATRKQTFHQRHPERQVTPMRKALMDLISKGLAWRWSDVWGLTGGQYTTSGVKKYMTVLMCLEVITIDDCLVMRAGPKAAEWMAKKPKTEPGGNANRHRLAQEARENLKKQPNKRTTPLPEIPRDLRDPLFTIREVSQILGCGYDTKAVTALVARGEIHSITIGKCMHRVFQSELCRFIKKKREAMNAT